MIGAAMGSGGMSQSSSAPSNATGGVVTNSFGDFNFKSATGTASTAGGGIPVWAYAVGALAIGGLLLWTARRKP